MAKTQKTTRSSPRPRNRPDDSYDPPGQSIEDFPDDQRIGVTRLPDGRHVVLPESLTRLAGHDLEIAADLQHVAAELRRLDDHRTALVREARDSGLSWNAIGWCVGTTGEAARQRFGA